MLFFFCLNKIIQCTGSTVCCAVFNEFDWHLCAITLLFGPRLCKLEGFFIITIFHVSLSHLQSELSMTSKYITVHASMYAQTLIFSCTFFRCISGE